MRRNERNAPSVPEGVTEVEREILGTDLEIEVRDAKDFFDRHFRQIGLIDVGEFNNRNSNIRITTNTQFV